MIDTILYLSILCISTLLYGSHFSVLMPPLRWLAVGIGITFVGNLTAVVVWRVLKQPNNLYVFHLLTIGQYVAFALMFSRALVGVAWRRAAVWSAGLFTLVSLAFSLTIQPWTHYNSYALTLYNCLLCVWALQYIRQLFTEIKVASLEKDPMFWVSTAILYTALGNLFVQGLMNYLIQRSTQHALSVYWIQELLNGLQAVLFIVAWYANRRYVRRGV